MPRKMTMREEMRPWIDTSLYFGLDRLRGFDTFYRRGWRQRMWTWEWLVCTGNRKRRRVGSLPPSPPPNGCIDLKGHTFFVEAI